MAFSEKLRDFLTASQTRTERKFVIGQWLRSLSHTDLSILQDLAGKAYEGEMTRQSNDDLFALIRIAVRAEGQNKKDVSRHDVHRLHYFVAIEELSRYGLLQIKGPMCLVRRALPAVSVTALGEQTGAILFGQQLNS